MTEKIAKHPGGRPSKYREEFARMARISCEEGGFTDLQLARLFDVSKSTINRWKKDHPEFWDSIRIGKDEFDSSRVETAFLKGCIGFRYTEVTREPAAVQPVDPETGGEPAEPRLVVTKKVSKLVLPNPRACLDWLTNRAPDRWKKVKHVELTGDNAGPVKTESLVAVPSGPMTIAQWEAEIKEARKHDKEIEPGQIPGNA